MYIGWSVAKHMILSSLVTDIVREMRQRLLYENDLKYAVSSLHWREWVFQSLTPEYVSAKSVYVMLIL